MMMPQQAPEKGITLVVRRIVRASRERVYTAWTSPAMVRQWWCADSEYECPFAEIDLRPGGIYRLAMRHREKHILHVACGRYLEVRAPEYLLYTWSWEGGDLPPDLTRVAVEFHALDEARTEIVITHTRFLDEQMRDKHGKGWNGVLNALEAVLARPG